MFCLIGRGLEHFHGWREPGSCVGVICVNSYATERSKNYILIYETCLVSLEPLLDHNDLGTIMVIGNNRSLHGFSITPSTNLSLLTVLITLICSAVMGRTRSYHYWYLQRRRFDEFFANLEKSIDHSRHS